MKYIWLFAALTGLISMAACRKKSGDGLPDMRITLASNDTNPMGGKVFRSIANRVFDDWEIESNPKPFNEWYQSWKLDHYHEDQTRYLIVSPYLNARKKEAEQMKIFVEQGNTLFVVTDDVSDEFKQEFGVGINRNNDTAKTNFYGMADTYKFMYDSLQFPDHKFGYYFYPFTASIDTVIDLTQEPVTLNMRRVVDGIQMNIGSGELVLVTNAEALSNYFLLTGRNYEYALSLLSFISKDPGEIYWDEFYRRNLMRPPENQSVFDAILSEPALRWAFWLLIVLCGLAVLTNLFRRQRVIPLKIPNKNTTVEFTQTIARLYYNKKDNRNIALKMIQHFLEHMRSHYYVPHQRLDDEFAAILAGKTNQPVPKIERLVQKMAAIQQGAEVNDDMLLELNRQLSALIKSVASA